MTFNNTTDLDGAIQECEAWLFGADYGVISGNTKKLKQFTKLINDGCDDTTLVVFEIDGKWQYDGSSNDDLPEATTNLADGQSNYTLLAEHLKIEGVEVMNSVGDYVPIYQVDYRQIRQSGTTETEFFKESGMPAYYDVKGDQLVLFPAPKASDVTETEGLKLIFQRHEPYFTYTDTTKEVGFPKIIDTLPVLFGCSKYAKQNGMREKAQDIDTEIVRKIQAAREFFARRNKDTKRALRPAYRFSM